MAGLATNVYGSSTNPGHRNISSTALIVMSCDLHAAQALQLPIDLISASQDEWLAGTALLPAHHVHLSAVGVIVLTSPATPLVAAHAQRWRDTFGSDAPPVLDLTGQPLEREKAMQWIILQLSQERTRATRRSVAQTRELALLRQQHVSTLSAFQKLETFAQHHSLTSRQLRTTLAPVVGSSGLTLKPGDIVAQRLPGNSVGISDVSIWIAKDCASAIGSLVCWMESPELGREIARWHVHSPQLQSGWLRLALEAALDTDPITLILAMQWQGDAPLVLETAMAHPDYRFRPILNGEPQREVLSLQLWHYVPGTRAPLSATGLLPAGHPNPVPGRTIRRIDPQELAQAMNLCTLTTDVPLFESGDALLVHVLPDRPSCAILPLAQSGAREISVSICTRHSSAPPIEYAIAVLSQQLRPRKVLQYPDFPKNLHSGWVRVRAMRPSQLTLFLPEPLDVPSDLYLMTRLPARQKSNAYGWSTFSDLTVRY